MTASERADEELHEQALAGDRQARDELKARLESHLYDLGLRISIDPVVATQATRAAVERVLACEKRGGLSFYAWCLATARDETLERIRSRGGASDDTRTALSPVDAAFSRIDATAGGDDELNGWVWQAARSQRPRDYSLLDLAIRRGLSADEIADATDMSHSGIYAILGRLRGLFEETFTSTLLYHRGREACPEVAALSAQHQGLGPSLRREIARHVEGCNACRQTRRSFPSPADQLASFTLVPAPAGLWQEDAGMAAAEPDDSLQPALTLAATAASAGDAANGGSPSPEVAAEPLALSEESDAQELAPDAEAQEPEQVPVLSDATAPEEDAAAAAAPASAVSTDDFPLAASTDLTLAVEDQTEAVSASAEGAEQAEATPARRAGRRAAAAGAAARAAEEQRLHFDRDPFLMGMGSGAPPRRPWDKLKGWFQDQGPARISLTVLFGGALILAIYLGLAFGASIEGGSDGSAGGGLAAIPTTTPGVRQIGCGSGSYNLDQGNSYTLSFDPNALPGFQISNVGVLPKSEGAIARALEAKASAALTLEVQAVPFGGTAGRTDEYVIDVTFGKPGEQEIHALCTVLVRAPAATAGPTTPTAAPTSAPTSTPRPAAPSGPAPTQPPPTQAPPTAIPVTPSPTYNPAIPTFTPKPPATNTPPPTATPTPLPSI
jgi:hypothetical protein